MALTPEDVVNKRFQPTKFREGYDQDEVDDFLDEVVVELRRLGQENEELRQRLSAAESRADEAQRAASEAPAAAPAPAPEPVAAAPEPVAEPEPVAAPEPVAEVAPAAAPAGAYVAPSVDETTSTNNLLQLARRLHEEHVREGIEKRDALIAEGHATAARIVSEAEADQQAKTEQFENEHRARVAQLETEQQQKTEQFEAEFTARQQKIEGEQRAQVERLDNERIGLEHRVDELRTFERDYRAKLKGYIEGQLRDLEGETSGSAPEPVAAQSSAPASFQGFGSN
ncbi:DivIVA domain-containing protein [Frondihabitans australicus]|uniref:Cell wall synthesis protein Wag31 n=1 Tax=Frondihabitans australicus TaxID=386892 RepID=A0A495IEV3_9MICO|nr:DivIVA domain-containing protein [Frondihabitans australicus]RKR74299.1 DivIVA domain-containing protein [Frondihabitans australicus]